SRSGSTAKALTVRLTVSGSAVNGTDYDSVASSFVIPAGASSGVVVVRPIDDGSGEGSETVTVTLVANAAYTIGSSRSATMFLSDNDGDAPPPEPPPVDTTKRIKIVWVDDAVPTGAIRYSDGGDTWNWVEQPIHSGKVAHRSTAAKAHH